MDAPPQPINRTDAGGHIVLAEADGAAYRSLRQRPVTRAERYALERLCVRRCPEARWPNGAHRRTARTPGGDDVNDCDRRSVTMRAQVHCPGEVVHPAGIGHDMGESGPIDKVSTACLVEVPRSNLL